VPTNADVRKVVPGITDETATMLSKKPDLLDALKKNPRAAEALKLCKSHCIPEFAEPSQVARLEKFFENGKSQGIELDQARLKEYLHKSKDTADLTKRLDKLEQAMTDAQPTGTIALKDAIMDQAELAADVGTYTTKIKWGIQEIEARPHGPGYWGKRTPQGNARVDAYELKINPNGESYYLPHPDGGFVQFEGLATGALKDGKLIMSPKSLYHVEDMPSFAKDKVLAEARRQMAAAKGPGLRVEWLVSDTKAETQLRTLFTTEGITIDITFLAE
jgi:hypothetical protein